MNLAVVDNSYYSAQVEELIATLPETVIDRAGNTINLTTKKWLLGENSKVLFLNWEAYCIGNPVIEYAFRCYFVQLIKTHMAGSVYSAFHRTVSVLTRRDSWYKLQDNLDIKEIEQILYQILSDYANDLRKTSKIHYFIHIRSWYIWCVEQELFGFTKELLHQLLQIKILGNTQGMAVLSNDINKGPLTDLEIMLIRNALLKDKGLLIERLCLWLALSYGCNPANFVLLSELDFTERVFNDSINESFYELKIPRIKKRGQAYKRSEFKTRKVDHQLAELIKQQIKENALAYPEIKNRPLLMRNKINKDLLATDLSCFAYNLSTTMFHDYIDKCIKRLNIVSPNTGEVLSLTPRRLRYTYATTMVKQGASAVELADLLDHSNLQHVQVYYNAKSSIVERLDIALAEKLSPLVNAFKGKIIDKEINSTTSQAINYQEKANFRKIHGIGLCGAKSLCNLYPPLSCYLCEKFQPWRDAPHGKVLDDLIADRNNYITKYGESSYYVKQLDGIIYSIAQVKASCNETDKNSE